MLVSTLPVKDFNPQAVRSFQFTYRSIAPDGQVRLGYALDDNEFEERFELPAPRVQTPALEGLLDLLHWIAGISYYKAAVPQHLVCETGAPPAAAAQLLAALYSEGLAEFAYVNSLDALPRPQFPRGDDTTPSVHKRELRSLLVPLGGGKDSAVAVEIARASGLEVTLFSVGDAPPIRASAEVAGLPRLIIRRHLDPRLLELNARGALNGHVPVTAIVSAVALLAAATQGIDAVAMANERSASVGSLQWQGVEVNHQFSKGRRAELLLAAATAEIDGAPQIFSLLRPASELAIARAFARFERYHPAFTSCNRVFALDPQRRTSSWCCDCDKCRFVSLILAPFSTPEHMLEIFGADLLDDASQYDGFLRLVGGADRKPFECVGELQESLAAVQLLAASPLWREHANVRRLAAEVLAGHELSEAQIAVLFALGDEHDIPGELIGSVREVLGA